MGTGSTTQRKAASPTITPVLAESCGVDKPRAATPYYFFNILLDSY